MFLEISWDFTGFKVGCRTFSGGLRLLYAFQGVSESFRNDPREFEDLTDFHVGFRGRVQKHFNAF